MVRESGSEVGTSESPDTLNWSVGINALEPGTRDVRRAQPGSSVAASRVPQNLAKALIAGASFSRCRPIGSATSGWKSGVSIRVINGMARRVPAGRVHTERHC